VIRLSKIISLFTVLSFIIGVILIPAMKSDEPPLGTSIYVDDDADPSWYDATHVKTIQEGMENASSGDIVYVYNGTYREHLVIDKALVFIGENRSNTIIEGLCGEDPMDVTVRIIANGVSMSGFTMQHSGEMGDPSSAVVINAHNCNLNDNDIGPSYLSSLIISSSFNISLMDNSLSSDQGIGISLTDSNKVTIEHNSISGRGGIEIHETDNICICNNSVNAFADGINFKTWSSNVTILNNDIISKEQVYHPLILYSNHSTIHNNTIGNGDSEGMIICGNGNSVINNSLTTFTTSFVLTGSSNTIADNVIVENGSPDSGLVLSGSTNIIIDNTISAGVALELTGSHNFIRNNSFTADDVDYGIVISGSDNTFTENKITVVHKGLFVLGSNNIISHNTITGEQEEECLYLEGINNYVFNNSMPEHSIELFGPRSNIIENNTCSRIFLFESSYNTIVNNTVTYSQESGIHLWFESNHNHITNNVVSNHSIGIDLEWSSKNIVEHNTVLNNTHAGIAISTEEHYASHNIIKNNRIKNNKYGIYLAAYELPCTCNQISNNIIEDNSLHGIYFNGFGCSKNNNITTNWLINNHDTGIYLPSNTEDTLVYHNNFVNNTENGYDAGIDNVWYNATLQEGNYWSDYTGIDSNGDGIGDTPHNISGLTPPAQDMYPLMDPWGAPLTIENEYPIDTSTHVERPPVCLGVDVTGYTLQVTFKWLNHTSTSPAWQEVASFDVMCGRFECNPAELSGTPWIWGNTTYTWSVNITNGISWTNKTFTFTTDGNRYDVNNNDEVSFVDAGLVWIHRTSRVEYDGLYDVNQDGVVNFVDAGLTWTHRST
jgi:parallel beta-helix repeat protein